MEPTKKAAILGAVLLALVLLVIGAGIVIGSTGMLSGAAVPESYGMQLPLAG